MDNKYQTAEMREPDLQVAGLQLWIHSDEVPESKDYWNETWLSVTAHCCASGADVWVSGPIIQLQDLHHWMVDCESMYASLLGEASMEPLEPNLSVQMKITKLGQIDMWVNITPDNLYQGHCFKFAIDQSYLPELIRGFKTIFRSYPIRGSAL